MSRQKVRTPSSGYGGNNLGALGSLGALIETCFWMVRSGVNPKEPEPRAWYDRTIRIVGGILLLIVFGGGAILKIIDMFKK